MPRTFLSTSTGTATSYHSGSSMTSLLLAHVHHKMMNTIMGHDEEGTAAQDEYHDHHSHNYGQRHLEEEQEGNDDEYSNYYEYPADAVPVKKQHKVMSMFLLTLLCCLVIASIIVSIVRCIRKNDPEWQQKKQKQRELQQQRRKERMMKQGVEQKGGLLGGGSTHTDDTTNSNLDDYNAQHPTTRYINACIEMSNAVGCCNSGNNTSESRNADDDIIVVEAGSTPQKQHLLSPSANSVQSNKGSPVLGDDYVLA